MPHWSFLKATSTTGTGATATRAMISVTTCAYHLKKGMHELYYFTEKLFMDFVSGQDHAMQLKAMGPRDPKI